MANIKYRLRRRQNGFVNIADMIDLTDESATITGKFIEIIDLTDCDIKMEASFDREKLDDFRRNLYAAFHRRGNQSMSLLRIASRVNRENKDRFSKKEIDSALTEMEEANEIFISNGLVQLI